MRPDRLPPELARVVAARGPADVRVVAVRSVSGGCISRTSRLTLSDGTTAFLKQHPSPPPRFFEAEAAGLAALASAGGVRFPQVYGLSAPGDSSGFLLLEDLCPPAAVSPGEPGPRFD